MMSKFPTRHYPPRQGSGFLAPRPYHQQFNRGPPPQYNRNHSPRNTAFSNHQYHKGPSPQNQGNTFPNRQYTHNQLQPSQGSNFPMLLDPHVRYVVGQITWL